MKLRILLSAFIICVVAATAFVATRATLSDQVTLAASTFSTGTVNLQISSSQTTSGGTFHDTSITGFTGSVLPGQTTSELLWLKNSSSDTDFALAAQSASISGEISPTDVTVTFTPVDNNGTTNTGTPSAHTLADWNSASSLNPTLIHNVNSGRQRYKMDVALSSSVTTSGSINFDFIFTGTQTP